MQIPAVPVGQIYIPCLRLICYYLLFNVKCLLLPVYSLLINVYCSLECRAYSGPSSSRGAYLYLMLFVHCLLFTLNYLLYEGYVQMPAVPVGHIYIS